MCHDSSIAVQQGGRAQARWRSFSGRTQASSSCRARYSWLAGSPFKETIGAMALQGPRLRTTQGQTAHPELNGPTKASGIAFL